MLDVSQLADALVTLVLCFVIIYGILQACSTKPPVVVVPPREETPRMPPPPRPGTMRLSTWEYRGMFVVTIADDSNAQKSIGMSYESCVELRDDINKHIAEIEARTPDMGVELARIVKGKHT